MIVNNSIRTITGVVLLTLCISAQATSQGTVDITLSGSTLQDTFVIKNANGDPLFLMNGEGKIGIPYSYSTDALMMLQKDNLGSLLHVEGNVGNCLYVANTKPDQYSGTGINVTSENGNAINAISYSMAAIYGLCNATSSPEGYGVIGVSKAELGVGVHGLSTVKSGIGTGIFGLAESPDGTGVHALNNSSTGQSTGVLAHVRSGEGTAVIAQNDGITGNAIGVHAVTGSGAGIAVRAMNSSTGAKGYLGAGGDGIWASAGTGGSAGFFEGKLSVAGEIWKLFGTTWQILDDNAGNAVWGTPSDLRLKKDIMQLPDALLKIEKLRGVQYEWNEEGLAYHTKDIPSKWKSESGTEEDNNALWAEKRTEAEAKLAGTKIGFIAQEVEEVFPQWVKEEDGYKKIDMKELDAVLVEAVKELYDIIKKQNERIQNQDERINKLERELARARTAPEDNKFSHSTPNN